MVNNKKIDLLKVPLPYHDKERLSDYTTAEIEYLEHIHLEMNKWNDSFVNESPAIPEPDFTEDEVLASNWYREICLDETVTI